MERFHGDCPVGLNSQRFSALVRAAVHKKKIETYANKQINKQIFFLQISISMRSIEEKLSSSLLQNKYIFEKLKPVTSLWEEDSTIITTNMFVLWYLWIFFALCIATSIRCGVITKKNLMIVWCKYILYMNTSIFSCILEANIATVTYSSNWCKTTGGFRD